MGSSWWPSRQRKSPPTPPVYTRDFAYANNKRILMPEERRMARLSVKDASAKSFADALEEAKRLRQRLLSGPMVDIYVGRDKKHWSLHRNLLCHHSSYFETEFQGHEVPKAKKTGQSKLELPDDDPRGFQLLVKWMYQGQLEDVSEMTEDNKYDYAVACHKLHMLCDKFDMLPLKNIAIDQYRRGLNESQLVPDAEEIDEIYRASSANSPFRKLVTKIAARQIMDPEIDKDAETYRKCFEGNPDFAVDMVNQIRFMSGGMLFEDPTANDECEYHDHSDRQTCSSAGKGKRGGKGAANGSTYRSLARWRHNDAESERRTPRKLNAATQRLLNGTPRESNLCNGVAAPPPTANSSPGVPKSTPKPLERSIPAKENPSSASREASRTASVASGPKQLSHSDGVFRQLNGVNTGSNQDSQSAAGASEGPGVKKKQPRKLGQSSKTLPNGQP